MCVLGRSRVGRFFEERGWVWIPLQTPGTAERLNCTEAELLKEMKIQLNSGTVIGGVATGVARFRFVWWLSPLGVLLTLPAIRQVAEFTYAWVARHRYCLSGTCGIRKGGSR